MIDPKSYNENPNLSAMRDDVANRYYRLRKKDLLITLGTALALGIAGAAIGALASIPAALAVGAMAAFGGLIVGDVISNFATMEDWQKLKVDKQYLQSFMQGKNYWGKGYREEVAEHGYSLGSTAAGGLLPMPGKDVAR